jgi:glycosyltransferase involved in cell wall biosynthesis
MLLWKLHSLDHRIASVRYRALIPIQALTSRGYRSRVCQSLGIDQCHGAEAIIFVKAFALKDLLFAQRARDRGVPIVLDLCDNIFVPNYTIKYPMHPAEVIQVMARYAAVITTTGPALMQVLEKTLEVPVPIMVVSDGIEEGAVGRMGRRILRRARLLELWRMLTSLGFWIRVTPKIPVKIADRLSLVRQQLATRASVLSRERRKISKAPAGPSGTQSALVSGVTQPIKKLIWFGHAGGDYGQFGLSDIVDLAPLLGQLARRIRFQLLVVSNSREAYERLVKPLPIDTRYVEWDSASIRESIRTSDVTIIPNSRDPFAICKSANRAVLSLSLGVPVVATRTPAMEILKECIVLDDWVEGLYRYLTDPQLVEEHLGKAREMLNKEFGSAHIADQWQDVLDRVRSSMGSTVVRQGRSRPCRTIGVVIHLMQDFDLAMAVLTEPPISKDLHLQAWVSLSLLESSPRVWKGLRAHGIDFRIFDDQTDADLELLRCRGVDAVLTIAETNQPPHRVSHHIVQWANQAGIQTYTMQHGFENIGLTYSDDRYPIERVSFASQVIFTWGPLDRLHPRVPIDTSRKCVPVGCCKAVPIDAEAIPLPLKSARVIGIFENLHWERYDREYAERFVRDAQSISEQNPDFVFLVKPHHAGRWLTSRYKGTAPSSPNLVIADPGHPTWEQFTASQLIHSLDGVITTPSTVALDAARAGKPVAVVGYGLKLNVYDPLPILSNGDEWNAFLRSIREEIGCRRLTESARQFASGNLYSGSGSQNILRRIAEDLGMVLSSRRQPVESVRERPSDYLQKVV